MLKKTPKVQDIFPLRIPQSFAVRIKNGNPNDPLLLQVLPTAAEKCEVTGFVDDPLQEQAAQKVPGLLHKYPGRVLITLVNDCPIHCRFCFRRHFPYSKNLLTATNWRRILKMYSNKRT